jgi:ribose-phosphate pyrophosphokinase
MISASCIFSLSESRELADRIAQCAGLRSGALEERDFEGGEFKLRPLESVRDRDALIVQCLAGTPEAPVCSRLVRLLFLLYGLRDAGARRRVVLLPYMTFARKDRRTQARDPVNTRYVAQLLEAAGATQLVTLDVHNAAALDNSFRVPVDHLSALPLFVDHLSSHLPQAPLTVASPDIGGVKRAQIFRELLAAKLERQVELAFFEKRRTQGVVSGDAVVGELRGRTVLIIDDLCATGNTLIRAAGACKRAGSDKVYAVVTHAPNAPGIAAVVADPLVDGVFTTDSVGYRLDRAPQTDNKLTVLSVAPLFGEALRRMSSGMALSPLLDRWPVRPADR